ncbi:hypothetical protein DMN91_003386 [Ooceraea biroi]|uniref:Uncharacterized protein n=1 Tax=Ooceraea biroi TaxID=2015173 RepID=A0A3L8DYJ3_OOCBI|nr:hypothetical protein DMN91_003386 [Ooceraea biroi]
MSKQELNSKVFKRCENNLVKKLSAVFLKNYPHHVVPGYNLHASPCIEEWSEESVMGLCQEFPYSCDLPRPLLPPARLPRTEFDEVYKKKIKWSRGSDGYNTKIPRYIADVAELIEMDPDPYFEGAYNWYYTGGSLSFVQLNGRSILLFPFMGDLVAANIVSMEDATWKPLLRSSAKRKLHGLLYETRQSKINNTCRILGRHKSQCALYTLTDSEGCLTLREIHHQASKMPYTVFDRPCLTLCPKFNLENCESLSVEAPSKHHCCRYLGTYHSFLMCDSRSPVQCVRQKWTHQFKSTPLLATVTSSDDQEIIVLSSQTVGENAIILNTWLNEELSHSYNLPFTPPCIAETLNESQVQGMCLNPYLRSRFKLSNTGSTLVADVAKGGVFHFLQNSIGDVFYQCITHENSLDRYSPVNGGACYALSTWEKALSAQAEPLVPLTLTAKYNMQHVYENFTNRKLRSKLSGENADDFEPTWKQSLATLGSYVDLLAPELLAVWDMREEVSVPVASGSRQKVLSWLDTATPSFPPTLTRDGLEEYASAPVNTQELISVSQQPDLTYIEDSNVLQEMLLPKVRSEPLGKKRRRLM